MKSSGLSWLHAAPVHGALTSESLKGMLLDLTKRKATIAEAAPETETTEAKESSVETSSAEAIKKIQRARKS